MFGNRWILEQILSWLRDFDKLRLLSTCHALAKMRSVIRYTNMHDYNNVKDLPHIDQVNTIYLYTYEWLNPTEHEIKYVTDLTCGIYSEFLPHRIKYLHILSGCTHIPLLPDTITSLNINIALNFKLKKIHIPPRLKSLSLTELYCGSLDWLPDCLEYLTIHSGKIDRIGKLPPRLMYLMLHTKNIDLKSIEFPSSLRSLYISHNSRVENLNEGLHRLYVIGNPEYIIIPQSVQELIIDHVEIPDCELGMYKQGIVLKTE